MIKEAVIIPVKDEREIAVPKKKDMAVPSQPPQSSPIKIVANDDIQEEPVYLIGEFEENQHKVHDTKKFSLNSQRLLKFLNNPDGYATGWHAETLSALEDFVTKYEIGELYLQEKSMEVLSAINARNCLLGKPDGGLAFIRIRNNDQIISWPNFNKDLLGKVIGPDGIEHDQIADIIHIAVPHCDMTSVTFYRFPPPPPQKNHGFAKKM